MKFCEVIEKSDSNYKAFAEAKIPKLCNSWNVTAKTFFQMIEQMNAKKMEKKSVEGRSLANTLKYKWSNLVKSPNVPTIHPVYQNSLI